MPGAVKRQKDGRSERGFENWKKNKKVGVKRYYDKNPHIRKKIQRESKAFRRLINKLDIIGHYSNFTFKCSECGEGRFDCLTVDHVYGGGTKHKKELRRSGIEFYSWVIKNGFPDGFRVLCMNCQFCEESEWDEYKQEVYYHTNR